MLSPDLIARLGELTDLQAAGALLGWDQQTMMPPAGGEARGNVMATLTTIGHERQTDELLGQLLDTELPDGDVEKAILRVARRDFDKASRVPVELAADMELAGARAQEPWIQARATNDFARFQPFLEKNLELRRHYAGCFEGEYDHPYDALLDDFEPGLTTEAVRATFAQLREGLVPLVAEIAAAGPAPTLPGPLTVAEQQAFAVEVGKAMGFAEDAWRLDLAVHPFASSLNPQDIRVTARYVEDDLQGLFAVMHEIGHGLYEHQVDPALARTTLGTGVSLGIHESQSRLWENLVGRSEPFWRHWGPRLRALSKAPGDLSDRDLLRAINVVEPSLIRVDADEVTYSLHVILRFELEVAMVAGELAVKDLPDAWNAGMEDLLGIDVPDDTRGCLQDIHWSYGEMGYFPTYAIGNIVAAQLWDAMGAAIPDRAEQVAAGEYGGIREWLREHVHRHGRTIPPMDLLQRATGSGLDPTPLLAQLRAKYGDLYSLQS